MERYNFDFHEAQEFRSIRDKLGQIGNEDPGTEIEEKIYDLIAVLNIIGFPVEFSCEGHQEQRRSDYEHVASYGENVDDYIDFPTSPYVLFRGSTPEENDDIYNKLSKLIGEYRESREKEIQIRVTRKNKGEATDSVNIETIYPEIFSLDGSRLYPAEQIRANLELYQQEFEDLAKFLFKKWLFGYRFKEPI